MKGMGKILLNGFLLWVIPLVIAIALSSVRQNQRPLFESIMAVVVASVTVVLAIIFFRSQSTGFVRQGALIGVTWFIVSVLLDQLLFTWGPMAMSFADYMMDIGATYLLIPVITCGMGYLLEEKMA